MLCVIVSVVLFFWSNMTGYLLLDALLKMHRSKTAVKKLKKEYTFLQKMRLLPFATHCLHAVRFCKGLILLWKIARVCFVVFLLIAVLNGFGIVSNMVLLCSAVVLFVLFDVPTLVLDLLFARPFIGKFRAYSFEKYHNTEDHNSLL